jgi:beta-glucosidase
MDAPGSEKSGAQGARLPFLDPDLPDDERLDDLIARLTLQEKIECLGTNPSVPRLGIRASGHVEGLHGLALGGPGEWGRDQPLPTTTFPQAIGLASTWAPELVRAVAEVEAREARYYFHHPRYGRGGLVIRAPNADLGRDPRWGRTEEC